MQFWEYLGNTLKPRKGGFGKVGSPQTMLCIGFGHDDGNTYTGTLGGEIYQWQDTILK